MTTRQRRLKLAYWKRVIAWNQTKIEHYPQNADRVRYLARIEEAKKRIHELRFPHVDKPVPATGPDISNLQASVDFAKVKAAGHAFVYLKAGEGDWVDPFFQGRVKAARHAGLKVGAYHFLRPKPGRTGRGEAQFFIENLRRAGLANGDLCPVADIEATKLSQAETRAYLRSFLIALQGAGYKPVVYTYASFNGGSWPELGEYPLWIAAYQSNEPRLPSPWKSYVLWQYSDKTDVPGVGKVDMSRTPDLRKLIA